jgi:2-polyprenyl-3-methyl-5-hydroxy-6-metoxy-1,4-benzoquinol methylase
MQRTQPIFRMINSFQGNKKNKKYTEYRNCPVCEKTELKIVHEYVDFQFFTDSNEEYKRADLKDCQCQNCFFLFKNPCYTDSGQIALFAEAGSSYGSSSHHQLEQIIYLNKRNLIKPQTKLLDVGCYEGGFLSKLPSQIYRMGVDVDLPAIERGREKNPDLFLSHGEFNKFTPLHKPNTITMFHVLEHLSNPIEVLTRLREISAPDVDLIIEVPILELGQTNDLNGFFSVQHLSHFSKNSLSNVILKSGWHIKESEEIKNYNGFRVVAVPTINKNMVNLESNDLMLTHQLLDNWKLSQLALEEIFTKLPDEGNFVIWGAGFHTEILYQLTSLFKPGRRFILIDSDLSKNKKTWRGIEIYHPSCIANFLDNPFHLIPSSYSGHESIITSALSIGVTKDKVINIYTGFRVY